MILETYHIVPSNKYTVGCLPINVNWSNVNFVQCIRLDKFYPSMAVSDVLLDALVLTVPLYPLYKLQMSRKQKIGLIGIFMLGALGVLAGFFRMLTMTGIWIGPLPPNEDAVRDTSYMHAPPFYWATIEDGVGIVSACLPVMRPLISRDGPESSLRSIHRKISSSLSNTKLLINRPSSIRAPSKDSETMAEPTSEEKKAPYQRLTTVLAVPHRVPPYSSDSIHVQSRQQQHLQGGDSGMV